MIKPDLRAITLFYQIRIHHQTRTLNKEHLYLLFKAEKPTPNTTKSPALTGHFLPQNSRNFDLLTNTIKRDKRHIYRIYKTTLGKVGKINEMSVIDFSTILISNMVCAAPQVLILAQLNSLKCDARTILSIRFIKIAKNFFSVLWEPSALLQKPSDGFHPINAT